MRAKILSQNDGAVSGHTNLRIDGSAEEMAELRAALAIVDKYKKKALKTAGYSKKYADWVMVDYAVKSDCVMIEARSGSCG